MIDVPQSAIELAKRFAGFEKRVKRGTEIAAVPYVCPAGFWTIGYGHLCAQDHQPITKDEAEGRLAAIVDFNFNLGAGRLQTSTLRRRLNQRGWIAASQELRRWVYGGGKVLPELALRREAEANFMSNDLK